MHDPSLPTLTTLHQWVAEHEDPSATMEELGLLLHERLERLGYWCTPTNTATFTSTGGDGVHFSLVDVGRGIVEASPVLMTVPMASDPNWIVGEDLREFLSLGLGTGYFSLEQLAYRADWPREIEAAGGSPLLDELAGRFDLHAWQGVAERLAVLRDQFIPLLVFGDHEPA